MKEIKGCCNQDYLFSDFIYLAEHFRVKRSDDRGVLCSSETWKASFLGLRRCGEIFDRVQMFPSIPSRPCIYPLSPATNKTFASSN